MELITNSNEYKKMIKGMTQKKKQDNEFRSVCTLVTDTQLLYWLQEYKPEIWEEFLIWADREVENKNDLSTTKI